MRSTELLARMRLDASQFDRGLATSQAQLNAFGRAATALPGGAGNVFGALARDAAGVAPILSSMPLAIAAVGTSLVALGVSARNAGVEFEATLAKISTLGPEAERTLGSTRQAILDTFSSVAVTGSVNDLAEANYLLQSSGRSAEEAITDLRTAAEASVAGYTSVTTAVDGLTTVTNAWKDSQISTATASDVLFSAVNVGKATFDDIANSIGLVAPLAASAGVRFQEVAAATAVLSNQGVRTSSIMEGLRSAISNIVKPTEAFKKEYGDLAREFGASRLQRDGLVQFLLDFQRESKGSRAALNALFSDITGQTAVLGLLKNGGADAAAALKQMETAAGATERAVAKVSETTKAQEQLIRNQISGAWTQFGELLNTVTLPILERVARTVNAITRGANFAATDVAAVLKNAGTSPTSQRGEDAQLGAVDRVVKQFQADPTNFLKAISRDNLDALATELQRLRTEGTFGIPAALVTALREERSRRDAQPTAEAFSTFRAQGTAAEAAARAAADEEAERQRVAAAAAAKTAADERERQRKAIVTEAAQLTEQLQAQALQALQGTAAAMQAALDKVLADGKAKIASGALSPENAAALQQTLDRYAAVQTQLIAAQRGIAETDAAIRAADQAAEIPALQVLAARERQLQAQLAITTNLDAQKLLEQELARLAKERAERTKGVFDLPDTDASAKAIRDQVAAYGDLAQQIATVGDKLGLLPQRTADALRGVGALVEQGKKLSDAFKPGSAVGSLGKVGLGVGIAAGVASIVASAFGDSPEDRQRRAELRRNTEAIRTLTARAGDLANANVAGRNLGRARTVADRVIGNLSRFGNQGTIGKVEAEARAAGLTVAELQAIAQSLGVTLNASAQSFRDLRSALDAADLAAYTDTFAGSLQQLEDGLRVDGVTDAVEILRRRIATLTDTTTGFPALATALQGIDLSTVEGRTDAAGRARAIFDQLAAGQLSGAQLGGLSIADARTALVDLIAGLREANTGSGTGGFNETRTVTEVTGSRAVSYLSQIAADVRTIAAAFVIPSLPTISPPSIAGFAPSASSGSGVVINGLTINITLTRELLGDDAGQTLARGDLLGRSMARGLAAQLDEELNNRRLRARLYAGDNRITQ